MNTRQSEQTEDEEQNEINNEDNVNHILIGQCSLQEWDVLSEWSPDIAGIKALYGGSLSDPGYVDLHQIRAYGSDSWTGNNFAAFMQLRAAMITMLATIAGDPDVTMNIPSMISSLSIQNIQNSARVSDISTGHAGWEPFSDPIEYANFQSSLKYWIFVPASICFLMLWVFYMLVPFCRLYNNHTRGFSIFRLCQKSSGHTSYNDECLVEEDTRDGAQAGYNCEHTDENQKTLSYYESMVTCIAGCILVCGEFVAFLWFLCKPSHMTTLVGDMNLLAILYILSILSLICIGACIVVNAVMPIQSFERYASIMYGTGRWVRTPVPDIFSFASSWTFHIIALAVAYESSQLTSPGCRNRYIISAILFFITATFRSFAWSAFFPIMHGDMHGGMHSDVHGDVHGDSRTINASKGISHQQQTNPEDRHIRAWAENTHWLLAAVASILMCIPHDDIVLAFFHRNDGGTWYSWPIWPLFIILITLLIAVTCVFFLRLFICMSAKLSSGDRRHKHLKNKRSAQRQNENIARRNITHGRRAYSPRTSEQRQGQNNVLHKTIKPDVGRHRMPPYNHEEDDDYSLYREKESPPRQRRGRKGRLRRSPKWEDPNIRRSSFGQRRNKVSVDTDDTEDGCTTDAARTTWDN